MYAYWRETDTEKICTNIICFTNKIRNTDRICKFSRQNKQRKQIKFVIQILFVFSAIKAESKWELKSEEEQPFVETDRPIG